MNEEKNSDANGGKKKVDWLAWILGIGNFLFVSLVGAFFTWKTNDLEEQLSTIRTAGQYIEIVARRDAPDYAKTLALSAIFDEGILSRDLLLEAAYRIEDDTSEPTVVGPLLVKIADSAELLDLPIGFLDSVRAARQPDGVTELTIQGWAIDDQGWSRGHRETDRSTILQVLVNGGLRCEIPPRPGYPCDSKIHPREDIATIFSQYPEALHSGFSATVPLAENPTGFVHLAVRLKDVLGHGRTLYSRCIDLSEVQIPGPLPEKPFTGSRCTVGE